MDSRIGWTLVAIFALGSIAAGGSPVHISYVESESMEPTINVGDGYILHSVGTVQDGDIITFWSDDRNQYVTHRIVADTNDGYITQGDNNPSTDQAGGHPPIQDEDVLGQVVSIGSTPIVIPYLGIASTTIQSNPMAAVALAVIALAAASLWRHSTTARPDRTVLQIRDIMQVLFVVGLCIGSLSMYIGGTSVTAPYMATSEPADEPYKVSTDEPTSDVVSITVDEPPFVTTVATSEDVHVLNASQNETELAVDVEIPPPNEPGYIEPSLAVHSYPSVLPRGSLHRLQSFHPLTAAAISMSVLLSIPYLASTLVIDGRTPVREVPARWPKKLRRWRL